MYRFLLVGFFLLSCSAAFPQKPQVLSHDELAAVANRGKLLFEYDQAAWHATDPVKALSVPQGIVDRYVAQKIDGRWIVMWGRFAESGNNFLAVYEAIQTAN